MRCSRGEAPGGVELVDEGADRVDHDAGRGGELVAGVGVAQPADPAVADPLRRDQLDVVGRGGTGLDGGTDEGEDEARVVVDEVGVLVLHGAARGAGVDDRLDLLELLGVEDARAAGAEQPDPPVGRGSQRREPGPVGGAAVEGGEEGDLLDVVRVRLHQPVPAAAQAEHQRELVVLEVLETAPHQVARLLAGEPTEVAAVDQGDARAATRQCRGRDRPVDAGADHEHVEQPTVDPGEVGPPQRHGPSVPPVAAKAVTEQLTRTHPQVARAGRPWP